MTSFCLFVKTLKRRLVKKNKKKMAVNYESGDEMKNVLFSLDRDRYKTKGQE